MSQAAAGRPAVLAIDGGNSKTEAALVAADGTVLSQQRGPGSNWQLIGRDEAMRVLGDLAAAVALAAGRTTAFPVAERVSACLAGADLPDEEEELTQLVRLQGWAAEASVVNDTFAVLRAGLDQPDGPHWGIGVTVGAGINCVGVAPDGRTTRFLALGRISGDWGGGGDLGAEALWLAARAEDGRGPDTSLRAEVPRHFGLASVQAVTLAMYRDKPARANLRGLAPVVLAAARAGDQAARGLVSRQADEVCAMVLTALRRLSLDGAAVPVVLGGSLLAAADPLLTGLVTAGLAAGAPDAVPRLVDVPPVAGAALLGLDQAGPPRGAEDRLRAAFRGSVSVLPS
ncbi:MAG TPA: BadF/BadG/BcrA/BcrD ATPase family protein [Streptosporangiaceae bacterium]|nr:BadF/BadG/BcrA/BcrD ATPase family protein [Streptosporangiaceae bacterium]